MPFVNCHTARASRADRPGHRPVHQLAVCRRADPALARVAIYLARGNRSPSTPSQSKRGCHHLAEELVALEGRVWPVVHRDLTGQELVTVPGFSHGDVAGVGDENSSVIEPYLI